MGTCKLPVNTGIIRVGYGEYPVSFTADEMHVVKAGTEALRLLTTTRTKSWELWTVVGAAIVLLRRKAIEVVAISSESYPRIFGEMLTMFKLKMDGGVRTRLLDLIDHRRDVEAWRDSLPPHRVNALTHPNSIWRAWKASRGPTIQVGPQQ
jgi:hypothetical protein